MKVTIELGSIELQDAVNEYLTRKGLLKSDKSTSFSFHGDGSSVIVRVEITERHDSYFDR